MVQRLYREDDSLEVFVIGIWLGGVIRRVPPFIAKELSHQRVMCAGQVVNGRRLPDIFSLVEQLACFFLIEMPMSAIF
ncbi:MULTISPECIES: hypothetical protein [unclassified Pseudomonas]|uniref:hypothetical protein n=1 Tax=unclassified Pseudomonas TaxID=196821 RepID=UPI001F36770A|nr:hypothetical protein [Pseudomonas sp. Leaf434]